MWSPTDNLIAYWVPEQNEIPTKIIIIQVPSKQEVSTKSRHLVSDVREVMLYLGNACKMLLELKLMLHEYTTVITHSETKSSLERGLFVTLICVVFCPFSFNPSF